MEKINVDDIQPSSRRYPAIIFDQEREAGDQILHINNLNYSHDGEVLIKDFSLNVSKGDKIAFLADNSLAVTSLFKIISGELLADSGTFEFGQTITHTYLPNENKDFFDTTDNLIDWLRRYSVNKDEVYIRGFLGKMLFTGEETFKSASVLSGGEKVRCMLSKTMLANANLIVLDEPTNHLDLESITALNNGLESYKGTVLFKTYDHELTQTVATRIIELGPKGFMDKMMPYDEFLASKKVKEQRQTILA